MNLKIQVSEDDLKASAKTLCLSRYKTVFPELDIELKDALGISIFPPLASVETEFKKGKDWCAFYTVFLYSCHLGQEKVATENFWNFCSKRGPFQGPRGLSSNARNWIVQGDTRADRGRDFLGKGHQVDPRRVREAREAALPRGVRPLVLGEGMGFWVAMLTRSFLVGHAWLSQDGCPREGFWGVESSWPFPNSSGWWWLISSFPGSPVVK